MSIPTLMIRRDGQITVRKIVRLSTSVRQGIAKAYVRCFSHQTAAKIVALPCGCLWRKLKSIYVKQAEAKRGM